MKKKALLTLVLLLSVITLTACTNQNAIKFKDDYESLNGTKNKSGKEHRSLNIDKDNPFIFTEAKDIVKKIENKETFYVYFGSKLCPWCRSTIEKAIEVANKNNIDKIYYVDIWDDEGNEILRDTYELKDGKPNKLKDGTKEYTKLLKYLDNVLSDYTLTDENDNKIKVGEKRIYVPNYIYIKKGKAIRLTTGISDKQNDSREKLTKEILKDEENQFNSFFKKS